MQPDKRDKKSASASDVLCYDDVSSVNFVQIHVRKYHIYIF